MLVANSAGRKISDPDKDLGASPDNGHQQGLGEQTRPLTSILPQVGASPEDINMASGGNTGHPPSLQLLPSPPDINTDSGRTTEPNTAPSSSPGLDYVSSGDSTDYSDWFGPHKQYRPHTSIWPPPAARPRDIRMISGYPHGLQLLTRSADFNTDSDYSRTTDPDVVLSSSLIPDINMVSRGHRGFPDWYGPHRLPRPLTSVWPPARPRDINMTSSSSLDHRHPHGIHLLTSPIDINTDSGYSRTTDPDMAVKSSMSPDINMSSGGGRGYSDWHGPQKQRSPQTSIWPPVAPQPTDNCMTSGSNKHLTTDINKDLRCSTMQYRADGAMDSTVGSDSNPAQGYQHGFRLKHRLRRSAWS